MSVFKKCLALMVTAAAFADAQCPNQSECYDDRPTYWLPRSGGEYDLGADILWWKPCINDVNYVGVRSETVTTEGVTDITYKYKKLCPDWEPGVRVYLDYPDLFNWSNLGLRASWTYITTNQRGHDDNSGVQSTLLHPGFVSPTEDVSVYGEYDALYQEWDALVYFTCSCSKCSYIVPYAGFAALIFNQDIDSEVYFMEGSTPAGVEMDWNSRAWGVGLRVGMDYIYKHSKCLNFYAFANGSVLAGTSRTHMHQNLSGVTPVNLSIKDDQCCNCMPGYHLGIGILSHFCICGWDFNMRMGYEFVRWHNIPKEREFYGDNISDEIGLSGSNQRSIGYHGPFVGLSLLF